MTAGLNPTDKNNAVAVTTNEPPAVYFGVVFELNGKEVALEPLTAINRIKQNGLECRLPDPVHLGEIGDNLVSLLDTLGADPKIIFDDENNVKPEIKELPIIGEIVETVLEADVTIEQFYLRIPPTAAVNAPTRYTVGLSAVWDVEAGKGKLFGNLYLKGLYLKVSNEDVLLQAAEGSAPTDGNNVLPSGNQ